MEQNPERMAAILLGLSDARVLGVGEDDEGLLAAVETTLDVDQVRCPSCGEAVVLAGTEELERQGAPVFGRPVVLVWRLREFACTNRSCPVETFSEALPSLSGA